MYSNNDHTFVVCAYKESPFLTDCIDSLLNQSVQSHIIISTSTPNTYITQIAEKYNLPVYVNTGRKSIADDWNYGYLHAATPLITIAHQDDIYHPEYLEKVLTAINSSSSPLICFTNYTELRNGEISKPNFLIRYKRIMLSPLKIKQFRRSRFIRRRILSLGCSICCPSVTFVSTSLPKPIFRFGYKSNVDWQAWESLSRLNGEFIYLSSPLMSHRIHADSETTRVLGENARTKEDYEMFCKFWPSVIARLLTKVYSISEKSNS